MIVFMIRTQTPDPKINKYLGKEWVIQHPVRRHISQTYPPQSRHLRLRYDRLNSFYDNVNNDLKDDNDRMGPSSRLLISQAPRLKIFNHAF